MGDVSTTYTEADIPFMITELCDNNIDRIVEQHKVIVPAVAIKFAIQVCDAMEYYHRQKIIHRDMKPGNLLVADDNIRVGDFGLAATFGATGADRFYRDRLTTDDEIVGPLLWMSPELVRYSKDKTYPVDHRSDLFQLGKIIWFMLTGENPSFKIDVADDPTGGQVFPIVDRLLERHPDKRFPNAADLGAALKTVKV